MDKVITVISAIAKTLKLEELLEKGIVAYLSYKAGQKSEILKAANAYILVLEKARQIEDKIKTDAEYKKKIEEYFNK